MTDRESAFDAKAYTSETLHAWFISGTPNLHEFMEKALGFAYQEGYREAGESIHKRKDVDRKAEKSINIDPMGEQFARLIEEVTGAKVVDCTPQDKENGDE